MEAHGPEVGGKFLKAESICLEGPRYVFFAPLQVSQLTVVPSASKVSEIRLRLAQEEAAEVERGQRAPHQVSASVFIRMGLELEEQQ